MMLSSTAYRERWEGPSATGRSGQASARFPEKPPTRAHRPLVGTLVPVSSIPFLYLLAVGSTYGQYEYDLKVGDKRSISSRLLRAQWRAADAHDPDAVRKAPLMQPPWIDHHSKTRRHHQKLTISERRDWNVCCDSNAKIISLLFWAGELELQLDHAHSKQLQHTTHHGPID